MLKTGIYRLVLCLTALTSIAAGQGDPASGLPAFGTFNRDAIDTVNVGNLNLHFEFPMFRKKGRGFDFSAKVVHDNALYRPMFSNSAYSWNRNPLYFESMFLAAVEGIGQVTYNSHSSPNGDESCWNGTNFQQYWWYSEFAYIDTNNTAHNFPNALVGGPAICAQPTTATDFSGDGYKLTVTVDPASGSLTTEIVTDFSGNVIDLIANTITDPNGNVMSVSKSNDPSIPWTWTDTTGYTALQLFPAIGSQTYKYPNPSGGSAEAVTLSYSTFNLQTNFQCPNIPDITNTTINLTTGITLPDGTSYSMVYESTNGTYPPTTVTGRIHSLTLPSGATITYTYSGSNNGINCLDGSPAILTKQTSDGTWTYNHYFTPTQNLNGYWTTIVTDPLGNDTVYTFGSVPTSVTPTDNTFETQRQTYQGSYTAGTVLRTLVTCYNGNFSNCGPSSTLQGNGPIAVNRKDVYTYIAGVSQPSLSEVFYQINVPSLVTQDNEFGFGINTGAAPSIAPLKATMITYANPGNNIQTRPACIQVTNGWSPGTCGTVTSNTASITNYLNYDSHGNVGTIQNWVSGSTYFSRSFSYFSTGLINTGTDFAQNPTTYTYGACNGSYPTQITSAGLSRNMSWDCNGGVVTSTTDENSQLTQYSYVNPSTGIGDPFWRTTRITYPRGGTLTNTYNDTASPANVTSTQAIDSSGHAITTQTLLDSSGRKAHSNVTTDPDGPGYQDFTYDGNGRSHCVTNPYRSTGDSIYDNLCTTYDALNRPTSTTRQIDGSSVTTQYGVSATSICGVNAIASVVTDEVGKKRQNWTDALGRLVEVDEPDSGGAFSLGTCYLYDAQNNLLSVTQRGGTANSGQWRVRTYVYDGLSRITSASSPESGTTTYTYDSNPSCTAQTSFTGELISKTDARGIRTCVQHDALHRVTAKTYSDGTAAVSYFYDQTSYNGLSITNGKSRRTGMSDGTGQTAWSYDADGNVVTKQQTIAGVTHSIGFTYNLDESVNTLTSPNGHVYTYGYGDAERPLSLSDNGIGATYVQNAHYNAPGQITSVQHGLGLAITETNNFNNQLQPLSLSVASTSQTLLSLSYTWPSPGLANNGTLYRIVNNRDSSNNRSTQYTYDELNRLKTAGTIPGVSTPWSTTYSYDAWGNLYQKATSGPGEPNITLTVDTNNRINGQGGGDTYDAAGNLTFDGANHFAFDAENHMTPAGGTVVYSYDGDGRRVKTITGDGTTQFWYDDSGTVISTTGAWTRDYVYFNGKRIAYFAPSSGNQHYYWPDHLGSARVMSNSDGSSIEWEADYLPFGTKQVLNNFLDNFFLFTGYQFDYEIGDNYAGAREQSPTFGRFLSPDPYGASANLRNPQSLNRYSYVLNNPVTGTDPSGLDCVYFNDSGTGVDKDGIDRNSSPQECADTKGAWINGTVDERSIQYDATNDTFSINSSSALFNFSSTVRATGPSPDGTDITNGVTAQSASFKSYSQLDATLTNYLDDTRLFYEIRYIFWRGDIWLRMHEKATDNFACAADPGSTMEIRSIKKAYAAKKQAAPPGGSGDPLLGGNPDPTWIPNMNTQRNGGQDIMGSPGGAAWGNAGAFAVTQVAGALNCAASE